MLWITCFCVPAAALELDVSFSPEFIEAGQDSEVDVTLTVTDGQGRGVSGAMVRVGPARGAVAPVQELGSGRYRATLHIPAMPAPRVPGYLAVAAVAAFGGDMAPAGAQIPVHSMLKLNGQSLAGARVIARGEGRDLGDPATADAQGRFQLNVPVPPGLETLDIVAAKSGREQVNTIALNVPERARLAAVTLPEKIKAGGAPGTVAIFAVTASGELLTLPNFSMECAPGMCRKPRVVAPGLFLAEFMPPGMLTSDAAAVLVSYEGLEASAQFSLAAGGPAELVLATDVEQAAPGDQLAFSLLCLDRLGQPMPLDEITLYVQGKQVDARAARHGDGYTITYTVPAALGAQTMYVSVEGISSEAPDAAMRSDEVAIQIQPAAVVLTLTAAQADIGPGRETLVQVMAADADGAPLSGLNLTAEAAGGAVTEIKDAGQGAYSIAFTAPDTFEAETLPLTISAPEAPGAPGVTHAFVWNDTGEITTAPETAAEPAALSIAPRSQELFLSGGQEAVFDIAVTGADGGAVADQQVRVLFEQGGEVQEEDVSTDMQGGAEVAFPLQPADGAALATAWVVDAPVVRNTTSVNIVRRPLNRIELTTTADSLAANGEAVLEIEALAIDETGADAAGERIEFRILSGQGRLDTTYCMTEDNGRCSVYYTAGFSCADTSVEAYAYRDDTVRRTSTFTETAAVPASLELAGSVAGMIANGIGTQEIPVTVKDAGGCPVSGETVTFSVVSGGGSVTAGAVSDAQGTARPVYTAGSDPGTAVLQAQSTSSPLAMLTVQIDLFSSQGATGYTVTTATTAPTAGQALSVTLTAIDDQGRTITTFDPSGLTFEFRHPASAPNGTAPSYPTSGQVAAEFTNGEATVQVTLYKAESVALAFFGGGITGTSAALTVSPGAADSISVVSGDAQQTKVSTQVPEALVTAVTDAWGNPVPGQAVTFTVAAGGGSVSGGAQTTDASGRASPTSWTLGSTPGTNQLTAAMATGGTPQAVFSATALASDPPTANITLESASLNVCAGDSVDFSSVGSAAVAPAALATYSWDMNGDGTADDTAADPAAYVYAAQGAYAVSLTVTDTSGVSDSATSTVSVTTAPGPLALQASPQDIDNDGLDTALIFSNQILDCGGAPVADGRLFTVSTTLGSITSADQDGGTPGIQVAAQGGAVNFTLQAGTATGTATLSADSLDGRFSDTVDVTIGLDTTPPFVVSFTPSGYKTGTVSAVTVKFSEDMNPSQLTNPAGISVTKSPVPPTVNGTRTYDAGARTLTFTLDTPLDLTGYVVTASVNKNARDLSDNKLDIDYDGVEDGQDFEFSFGALADQTPPSVSCVGDDPDPFSPDGVHGAGEDSDTTTISFNASDDTGLLRWLLEIKSSGQAVKTFGGAAAGNPTSLSVTQIWDGRNQDGEMSGNGVYTYEVFAYDTTNNLSASCGGSVEVKNPVDFNNFGP